MRHTTNTTQLTETQQENIYQVVSKAFESKFTNDFWHFSNEGNLLDLSTMKTMVVFEVHSASGSFEATVLLNDNKKALKSTIKFNELV